MSGNIVVEWLRSLGLTQYSESFLDNGYDDLEICKQVGDPDLDAIGVTNPAHRARLLHSIRTLREEGAASVYFTLEESAAIQEECKCESSSRSPSSTSSLRRQTFDDEYEEGKAELVRIPKRQLKLLLKERLTQEGIRLSSQPYSTSTGERGYLEGIASRYSEMFRTHYGDVLADLEEIRQKEWAELSPRMRVLSSPLTSSQSQPIYVPGKYSVSSSQLSPSSCLSDREEDEVYGFGGYGVYGKQMMHRHQANKLILTPNHNYHNCLSPRSAYFYEFPPNERPPKKKTSLSKLLRSLKTYRRDKSSTSRTQVNRCGTPEGGLEGPLQQVDYDRAKLLHKAPSNTFEETIHRLKVQEAMKKKERIDREQEEILRNIREGMAELGGSGDDTYMYEDEIHEMHRLGHHWYDEPPYESDPEDFLMADPTTSRHDYPLRVRRERLAESEVISLRSAGDITLAQPRTRHRLNRESGDYATSDVHSVCSRLSSLSMETSRSDQLDTDFYRRLRPYNGSEPPMSPGQSSDYAEHEDLASHHPKYVNTVGQRSKTLGIEGGSKRKHHHHHHHHHRHHHRSHGSPNHHKHSSAESLPSASSTQALVSNEERSNPPVQVLALARATCHSSPTHFNSDTLNFKKGDIIEVTSMSASGLWSGRVGGRCGFFKFTSVELLTEAQARRYQARHNSSVSSRPQTLAQMLQAIQMEEHMSLFVLNGYNDLESFCEIQEKDLDYLGLTNPEHRAKILAAIQVLQDFEIVTGECSGSETGGGDGEPSSNNLDTGEPPSPGEPPQDENFLPNIPLQGVEAPPPPATQPDPTPLQRNCCGFSEKSSDSGVSSSSVSSNQTKNKQRRNQNTLVESPVSAYDNHIDNESKLE